MVNFMGHLDWPPGCQIVGHYPGCVCEGVCGSMTLELVAWVKPVGLPSVGALVQSTDGLNTAKRQGKTEFTLSVPAGTSIFLCFGLGLRLELRSLASRVSGLQTQTGTTSSALPNLHLADRRSWDFSASVIVESVPYYLSYWFYFSGEPRLIQF